MSSSWWRTPRPTRSSSQRTEPSTRSSRRLIERLDRRQDQVLIETALIETSGSDFLDIGVELGFADIPGTTEDGGVGVTSFGLSTLVDSDGDGIVDLRTPNVSQGVTAGIIDGNDFSIPALLAMIETEQDSNVLNVPSVLVNNNAVARVSQLTEQPTTQITAVGGGVGTGQTQENFAGYEPAGITMEISPSISASRYLRLERLPRGLDLRRRSERRDPARPGHADDRDRGQRAGRATMVIGGIVIDNEANTTNQVPWIGDIPILGRLFRRDSTSKDRTVLYFFVTPHILQDKDFADLAEISFRKKLEASEFIGLDRVQQMDPDFGVDAETGSPISLEGFDLPLYTPPGPRGDRRRERGYHALRGVPQAERRQRLTRPSTRPPTPSPW